MKNQNFNKIKNGFNNPSTPRDAGRQETFHSREDLVKIRERIMQQSKQIDEMEKRHQTWDGSGQNCIAG